MANRRNIPDPILMVISILVVTGFQIYWLKNNYDREKKNLEVTAGVDFQETIRNIQASKLKLNIVQDDSSFNHTNHEVKIVMKAPDFEIVPDSAEKNKINAQQIVTIVNAFHDRRTHDSSFKATSVVSTDKEKYIFHSDSLLPPADLLKRQNNFIHLLSGVDSLQDSLKIEDINAAYEKRLKQDKIPVQFSISKIDSFATYKSDLDLTNVVVGFSHPKTYQLKLTNSFPFLLKKISTPIIFSIFLVGLTVISFIILYRNVARQRRLTEIKNEFISNITHELKTPIATVSVAIEALKSFDAARDPQKAEEYLNISASELQRLGLLVDKVLKLSMLENRNIELKKESFDMLDLVNEVLQIMKVQFEKQHAQVSVETINDNFLVEADRLHITSVLYNLLDNALKYSGDNPVITIQLSIPKENILQLKISDNGPGIPKEYQSKIFEKFFRIPSGDTHNSKGYGLGLSYVREIIIHHMGYITVESEKDNGSTFIIMMPMKASSVVDFGNGRKIFKKEIHL